MTSARRRPEIAARYAAGIVTHRWSWLCFAGAVIVALLSLGAPNFGRDGLTLRELAAVDAPEIRTEILAAEHFQIPLNARVQVVRRNADGLSLDVQRGDVRRAYDLTRAAQDQQGGSIGLYLPFANTRKEFPSSGEASTTTITNVVGYPDATLGARERAGRAVADQMELATNDRVSLTGGVPAQLETGRLIRAHLGKLQALSIAALVLITLLWQRSLVVPIVVLATIGSTSLLMLHGLGLLSRWLTVPAEVLPVVLSVAIGVATDYVLFYLGSFRRHISTTTPHEAARLAIEDTAPVVLTAGATTALGAASLLLAETGFVRAFAPGLVVAVVSALIASLLLTPIMVAVAAPRLLWPIRPKPTRTFGGPVGLITASRARIRTLAVTAGVLLAALASQVGASPLGFNIVTGLPEDNEITIGARDAAIGFAPGILSSTIVLVEGTELRAHSREVAELANDLEAEPGVAGVLGANTFERALRRTGLDEDLPQRVTVDQEGLLTTADGRFARIIIVLEREAFTGAAARDLDHLIERLPELMAKNGLDEIATASVAGDTALVRRVAIQLDTDLIRVGSVLLIVELGLLYLALRRWRLAIFVVSASLVVTTAAVGATSLVDRYLGDGDGIAFFVPIAAFVLLVSIGVDYGVLMGQALHRVRSTGLTGASRAAAAMHSASPTIVQAGVVLTVTFALLAVVPLGAFTQFAVVMGTGVALDTLLIRPFLMPVLLSGALRHPGPRPGAHLPAGRR